MIKTLYFSREIVFLLGTNYNRTSRIASDAINLYTNDYYNKNNKVDAGEYVKGVCRVIKRAVEADNSILIGQTSIAVEARTRTSADAIVSLTPLQKSLFRNTAGAQRTH